MYFVTFEFKRDVIKLSIKQQLEIDIRSDAYRYWISCAKYIDMPKSIHLRKVHKQLQQI